MVVGITGGVGCGKSTVMKLLEEQYKAKLLVADELGHQVMVPGTRAYYQIRQTFGDDLVQEDGQLNRGILAEKIYADDRGREKLNAIIHPCVKEIICQKLEEWREEPLICLETAILFETGCDEFCDTVWCVLADREIRISRLMTSRGYSREKAESIMKVQLPEEEWVRRCDESIENNGDLQKLSESLQELLVTR
ncbi:MAG: dephospho-CoA kinase [Eubacterium sp.]|nr:dephospho-CoA kinase [Eubacterium sp.]